MADVHGPIASAVIIPDSEQSQASSKRRQSSVSEATSKRLRLSYDANAGSPTALRESPSPIQSSKRSPELKDELSNERCKSSVVEEKKRGQRLFGGLLSTLSQSTPNGQQKRRLEIEKRQQERAKQQKLEDEVRRSEKLAKLKAVRIVEQVKFDEASMRMRHTNMLAMARFLSTKSEPKLYYVPWKLRPADEERIKDQIINAQRLIDQEVAEFEERHPEYKTLPKNESEDTNDVSKETVGEPTTESQSDTVLIDTTNDPPPLKAQSSDQSRSEKQTTEEHNGEVVMEHEEDTVIY